MTAVDEQYCRREVANRVTLLGTLLRLHSVWTEKQNGRLIIS